MFDHKIVEGSGKAAVNYQEKVCTRADVRGLYAKVVGNPAIEKYRGYTESKSYGWDAAKEDYIKCDGEVWFENPAYDMNFVPEGECRLEGAELLDEQILAHKAEIELLQKEKAQALHMAEVLHGKLAEVEKKTKELVGECDRAKARVEELRHAFAVIRTAMTE